MAHRVFRIALLFTVLAWTGSAVAQAITRVVLYPGSATIERSARVAAGNGRVEMSGLPAGFDLRTLRVEGDAGISVGEVSVQDVARAEALGGREAELESRIQALKDQKAALDVEVKSAELVRDYLASLSAKPSPTDKPLAIDPKALPTMIDAIRRGAADSYGLMQRAEVSRRGLDKQIAALERDLARLRSGARDVRTLSISYFASRPGALRAAYQVANAGWRPMYRASLDSSGSRVELERQAAVMQRTGEDWSGVRLRLSTGQPRPAQLVDPQPWQLVVRQPGGMRGAPAAARLAMRDEAREEKAAPPEIVAQFETPYATEFEVPGSVDLPADGRQVTVALATQALAVKQRIRVVPRRDTAAMVTAEAPLPEGVWIPGDVQLYRDGSYIGSTAWQPQAKDRLVLPFGRDDRVHVTVNRTANRRGSAGLVGQRAERQVADLYAITSRHKVPVELLVLEASPVAVSDQITVESTFQPAPKLQNWEDRRGVVAWEQPLAPGETLKFIADYTISYPKDAVIVGLP